MSKFFIHPSPRIRFMQKYILYCPPPGPERNGEPNLLDIGCADDPMNLGESARHVDIDDWSKYHKYFTQADAHNLPFDDGSYHTVLMGDIIEHLTNPWKAVQEAMRVSSDTVCFTIFEEWRLSTPGQHIDEGQSTADTHAQLLGCANNADYYRKNYPDVVLVDDSEVPHLTHINQFTDEDIKGLVASIQAQGWTVLEFVKMQEAEIDDHIWNNWLISARRIKPL